MRLNITVQEEAVVLTCSRLARSKQERKKAKKSELEFGESGPLFKAILTLFTVWSMFSAAVYIFARDVAGIFSWYYYDAVIFLTAMTSFAAVAPLVMVVLDRIGRIKKGSISFWIWTGLLNLVSSQLWFYISLLNHR